MLDHNIFFSNKIFITIFISFHQRGRNCFSQIINALKSLDLFFLINMDLLDTEMSLRSSCTCLSFSRHMTFIEQTQSQHLQSVFLRRCGRLSLPAGAKGRFGCKLWSMALCRKIQRTQNYLHEYGLCKCSFSTGCHGFTRAGLFGLCLSDAEFDRLNRDGKSSEDDPIQIVEALVKYSHGINVCWCQRGLSVSFTSKLVEIHVA